MTQQLKLILQTFGITLAVICAFFVIVASADEHSNEDYITNGGKASLRGLTELDTTREADPMKRVPKDREPFRSAYVYQPPLVPHSIRGYELTSNANKCLSCHSFKNSVSSGATKISVTHYATREGEVLSDVSPRRYFCLQCHVTQSDAGILLENEFQQADSLR